MGRPTRGRRAVIGSLSALRQAGPSAALGTFLLSWHIENRLFAQDLSEMLRGTLGREAIPTRELDTQGVLRLRRP